MRGKELLVHDYEMLSAGSQALPVLTHDTSLTSGRQCHPASPTTTAQPLLRGSGRSLGTGNDKDALVKRAAGEGEEPDAIVEAPVDAALSGMPHHGRQDRISPHTSYNNDGASSGDDPSPTGGCAEDGGCTARGRQCHQRRGGHVDVDSSTHARKSYEGSHPAGLDVDEGNDEQCSDEPLERTSMQPLRLWMKQLDPLFVAIFKWCMAALLLLFLCFVVFGILYSGIAYHSEKYTYCNNTATDNTSLDGRKCDTPFDTILGAHNGVFGFSNCYDDYYSHDDSFTVVLTTTPAATATGRGGAQYAELYSGLRWQCVEYARRYWIMRGRPEPAYFGSVDGARDIWDETEVYTVYNKSKTLPLHRYHNGRSVVEGTEAPQVGDIIIYERDAATGFPHGHVAVVVAVNAATVLVAEQNWSSAMWPAPFMNYSRSIPLSYDPVGLRYTMQDPDGEILGWMRYG